MTRLRVTLASALLALLAVVGYSTRVAGQLPGYPVGIPQSVQSTVYGYLFGGTWAPAGAGALLGLTASVQPQAGNSATIDGVYIKPTLGLATSALATVTSYAGLHVDTIVGVTSGVTNAANVVWEAPPTGATNNYGAWLKGSVAMSATPRMSFDPVFTPSLKVNTFGTSPTIIANGSQAFIINVGTGGTATSGVVVMPTATTGWACQVTDRTTQGSYTRQTATAVDSITISNYGYAASAVQAWTASDVLQVTCFGY